MSLDNINEKLETLASDSAQDDKQNRTLKMHWKIHSWSRECFEELEDGTDGKVKLPPWPDLDVD